MNIITIWWWHWNSAVLSYLFNINNTTNKDINIQTIVSMSDDWRTTWALMKAINSELWIHLPPPWDVRRCLYTLSKSKHKSVIISNFETKINLDISFSNITLLEIVKSLDNEEFTEFFKKHFREYLSFKLPLEKEKLKWHKFWNILIATLSYNLWSYKKTIKKLHKILNVKWTIIPVTTDKAFIEAVLEDWSILKSQDHISNIPDYNSKIKSLQLADNSKNARCDKRIKTALREADLIIITPWDLYTSICSNWIWNFAKYIENSKAKLVIVLNSSNKWWEMQDYSIMDILEVLEKYLSRKVDYIIWNNTYPEFSEEELYRFKNSRDIKWWDFLILDSNTKSKIKAKFWKDIKIYDEDLIDKSTLFKYWDKLEDILNKIIESIKNV